jgi:hypothetical protein
MGLPAYISSPQRERRAPQSGHPLPAVAARAAQKNLYLIRSQSYHHYKGDTSPREALTGLERGFFLIVLFPLLFPTILTIPESN